MVEQTVQVTEEMAAFIEWANQKGIDEVRKIIRDKIDDLRNRQEKARYIPDEDGLIYDPLLEESDSTDQWKGGGDCNKCRRVNYCLKKCRANRLLKAISTPALYKVYLAEHPEVIAKGIAHSIKAEDVARMVEAGADGEEKSIRIDEGKTVIQ